MGGHLKLVPSFILAVLLLGQATQVEIPADVKEQLWERFGSLTSDEDIKNKIQNNLRRMMELAVEKLRTYERLLNKLPNTGDEELNELYQELYQENTESQAQIRNYIEQHLQKMIRLTLEKVEAYDNLSGDIQRISEDDFRESYQEYKDMLLNSKADKGRHIDLISIFSTVAVSIALLGF